MTWLNALILIAILCISATLLVIVLIRGGARKQGLDQRFLDDEQAKALRDWDDAR